MILFEDILKFLGLGYRDDSPITLHLVAIGISILEIKKVKSQHVLNGRTDILVTIIEFLRFLSRI